MMYNSAKIRNEEKPSFFYNRQESLDLELLKSLGGFDKSIPPKYFYDEIGSRLFDKICHQPEYYLSRSEKEAISENIFWAAPKLEDVSVLIELGGCNPNKMRLLLPYLPNLRCYVPIDISKKYLLKSQEKLRIEIPDLEVLPQCADFLKDFRLPKRLPTGKKLFFFPGSTIGNMTPSEVQVFLYNLRQRGTAEDMLLIGVDLKKDPRILEAAYNDASKVTDKFNKNILSVLNSRFGANFNPDFFDHRAFYDRSHGRIEMHLVCNQSHEVRMGPYHIDFKQFESIHTENSYKYGIGQFQKLAYEAGLFPSQVWLDSHGWFSVHLLHFSKSYVH